jgi:hypothetical protein
VPFTPLDTYSAVIPSLGRVAADAADTLFRLGRPQPGHNNALLETPGRAFAHEDGGASGPNRTKGTKSGEGIRAARSDVPSRGRCAISTTETARARAVAVGCVVVVTPVIRIETSHNTLLSKSADDNLNDAYWVIGSYNNSRSTRISPTAEASERWTYAGPRRSAPGPSR